MKRNPDIWNEKNEALAQEKTGMGLAENGAISTATEAVVRAVIIEVHPAIRMTVLLSQMAETMALLDPSMDEVHMGIANRQLRDFLQHHRLKDTKGSA